MTTQQLNNLRLFIKLLVTSWVPIVALAGLIDWDTTTTAIVMGASTASIDGLFRIWGIEDAT